VKAGVGEGLVVAVVRFLAFLLLFSLSALAVENSQTASKRKLATHWYVWDAIESNRGSPLWMDTIKTLPTRFYLDKVGMMVLKDTVDIVATKAELDGKADTISLGADSVVCTDGAGHLMTWIEATKLTWLENVESDIQAQLNALGVVDTIKVGDGMSGGGKGKEVTIRIDSAFFATKFFVEDTLSNYQLDSDTSTFDATKTWVTTSFQQDADTLTFDATKTWVSSQAFLQNPSSTLDLWDDFITGTVTVGAIGLLRWTGSATTISYIASQANHPGIRRIATSATANNICAIYTNAATNDVIDESDLWDFTFIVSLVDSSSCIVFVGAMDSMLTSIVNHQDRYGFQYQASVSPYWLMTTGNGSASTATATDVAANDTTWFNLRIVRTVSGVDYYIDGTSKGTVKTNLPDTDLAFGFHVQTTTTAVRALDIDYFRGTLSSITR